MPNEELKKILYEVDVLLSRISVNKEDVFAMCDARRLLNTAFKELSTDYAGKEESKNGR